MMNGSAIDLFMQSKLHIRRSLGALPLRSLLSPAS
jgi:hypothetical protein